MQNRLFLAILLKFILVQTAFTLLISVLKCLADFKMLLSFLAVIHLGDHVALEEIFFCLLLIWGKTLNMFLSIFKISHNYVKNITMRKY